MDDVLRYGSLPVPNHLRSATWREKRDFGTGKGYVYPHDYVGADVDQQYLPDRLRPASATTSLQITATRRSSASGWTARRRAREASSRGRRSGARPDGSPEVGCNEGRRQRHGASARSKKRSTAARQKREASGLDAPGLVERQRDHAHHDEHQPQDEQRPEQQRRDEQDAAHVLGDIDVFGRGLGREQAARLGARPVASARVWATVRAPRRLPPAALR